MASFFVELWEGIFTPGPTPTILKATNITFAALQLVLGALLLATHSVHFVVLSVLCGGLWWSVNWFARELRVAQAAAQEEEQQKKKLGVPTSLSGAAAAAAGADAGDVSGSSDTEVEGRVPRRRRSARNKKSGGAGAVKADVEPVEKKGELKQRSLADSVSSVSTEDEWERVSENEREKEK
ncbi:ER protein Pkr1 domain-containing protein [Trichoderma gracile]